MQQDYAFLSNDSKLTKYVACDSHGNNKTMERQENSFSSMLMNNIGSFPRHVTVHNPGYWDFHRMEAWRECMEKRHAVKIRFVTDDVATVKGMILSNKIPIDCEEVLVINEHTHGVNAAMLAVQDKGVSSLGSYGMTGSGGEEVDRLMDAHFQADFVQKRGHRINSSPETLENYGRCFKRFKMDATREKGDNAPPYTVLNMEATGLGAVGGRPKPFTCVLHHQDLAQMYEPVANKAVKLASAAMRFVAAAPALVVVIGGTCELPGFMSFIKEKLNLQAESLSLPKEDADACKYVGLQYLASCQFVRPLIPVQACPTVPDVQAAAGNQSNGQTADWTQPRAWG